MEARKSQIQLRTSKGLNLDELDFKISVKLRRGTKENKTKAESISGGRHELLVCHDYSDRTDDIHSPSANIGDR